MAFIAGAYTATYNALRVGQLAEGITFHSVTYKEIITGDQLARAAQDAVFQGIDVTSDYILLEWNAAAALGIYWPYGTAFLNSGVVGRLDVQQNIAKGLVLTAIGGPPAGALGAPGTVTLSRSILHEEFPVDAVFASKLRKIPIRMRHYPDPSQFASDNTALYGNIA